MLIIMQILNQIKIMFNFFKKKEKEVEEIKKI
jgi:hypothetical protein